MVWPRRNWSIIVRKALTRLVIPPIGWLINTTTTTTTIHIQSTTVVLSPCQTEIVGFRTLLKFSILWMRSNCRGIGGSLPRGARRHLEQSTKSSGYYWGSSNGQLWLWVVLHYHLLVSGNGFVCLRSLALIQVERLVVKSHPRILCPSRERISVGCIPANEKY